MGRAFLILPVAALLLAFAGAAMATSVAIDGGGSNGVDVTPAVQVGGSGVAVQANVLGWSSGLAFAPDTGLSTSAPDPGVGVPLAPSQDSSGAPASDGSSGSSGSTSSSQNSGPGSAPCDGCPTSQPVQFVQDSVDSTAADALAASPLPAPSLLDQLTGSISFAVQGIVSPLSGGHAATAAAAVAQSPPVQIASSSTEALAAAMLGPAPTVLFLGTAAAVLPENPVATSWWRRFLIGVLGFTRLNRASILDVETRGRIHDAVRATPGSTTRQVSDRAMVSRSATRYHLEVLAREGYITGRKIQRNCHWYVNGVDSAFSPEALAYLAHPMTGAIARIIREKPGVDQSTICSRLHISASLAIWHLKRLEAAGVIESLRDENDARRRLYAPRVKRVAPHTNVPTPSPPPKVAIQPAPTVAAQPAATPNAAPTPSPSRPARALFSA
ncbi:MAG: winged helix-turn-helix transcriptional regulator [Thermoplasmatota archaeon]